MMMENGHPKDIAIWKNEFFNKFLMHNYLQIEVAVKMLHNDDKVNKQNFLKEAEVMMNLNHLYIVKLVGVCHGPPVAMVSYSSGLTHFGVFLICLVYLMAVYST